MTEEREKRSGWDGYLSATDRVLTGLKLGKDGLRDDFYAILTISASPLLVCPGAEEEVDKQGNRSVSVDGDGDGNGDSDGAANEMQINAGSLPRDDGVSGVSERRIRPIGELGRHQSSGQVVRDRVFEMRRLTGVRLCGRFPTSTV